jgi:hypothetical protein
MDDVTGGAQDTILLCHFNATFQGGRCAALMRQQGGVEKFCRAQSNESTQIAGLPLARRSVSNLT